MKKKKYNIIISLILSIYNNKKLLKLYMLLNKRINKKKIENIIHNIKFPNPFLN